MRLKCMHVRGITSPWSCLRFHCRPRLRLHCRPPPRYLRMFHFCRRQLARAPSCARGAFPPWWCVSRWRPCLRLQRLYCRPPPHYLRPRLALVCRRSTTPGRCRPRRLTPAPATLLVDVVTRHKGVCTSSGSTRIVSVVHVSLLSVVCWTPLWRVAWNSSSTHVHTFADRGYLAGRLQVALVRWRPCLHHQCIVYAVNNVFIMHWRCIIRNVSAINSACDT